MLESEAFVELFWVGEWRLVGQGLHHTSFTCTIHPHSTSASCVFPSFSLISSVILINGVLRFLFVSIMGVWS